MKHGFSPPAVPEMMRSLRCVFRRASAFFRARGCRSETDREPSKSGLQKSVLGSTNFVYFSLLAFGWETVPRCCPIVPSCTSCTGLHFGQKYSGHSIAAMQNLLRWDAHLGVQVPGAASKFQVSKFLCQSSRRYSPHSHRTCHCMAACSWWHRDR